MRADTDILHLNVQQRAWPVINIMMPPKLLPVPPDAIAQSAHRITGTLEMGTQAHFQLETQRCRCSPNDDGGMNVVTTTQWIDATSEVIAQVLNIPQSA